MTRVVWLLIGIAAIGAPVHAQSLYMNEDERAIEAGVAWSVGPSSNGVEFLASTNVTSRIDLGFMVARYTYTFEDDSESTFNEYAPFVRYFAIKERQDGAPVSLAFSAQIFLDDYSVEGDSGTYAQFGTALYKHFDLTTRYAVQPFVGFGFVAESYSFGGGPAERAQYLTRDIGLHFTTATDQPWFLKATLIEQSFRRETYRGARLSVTWRR
jgi:hypothetical protein